MITTGDVEALASGDVDLATLYEQTRSEVGAAMAALEWTDDEIEKASKRHPDEADKLYHAFGLIAPRKGMGVEFVYRGHARELLERVAAGQDTRPGTAAEVCLACSEASLLAPMNTAGAGLYFRMWAQAFPGHPAWDGQGEHQEHYEGLRGRQIDEMEALTRRKLTDPSRRLSEVKCKGTHHGEAVVCRYAGAGVRSVDDDGEMGQLPLFG